MMAASLKFHARLYPRKALQAAMAAYADFARFTLVREEAHFAVDIDVLEDEHRAFLPDEFANYVLAETIELKNRS
jgi:hypothetical protein